MSTIKERGYIEGIKDLAYKAGLRKAYLEGIQFINSSRTCDIESDSYNMYLRPEEITNGKLPENYYGDNIYQVINNNYTLTPEEQLKIYITYKIAIKNQSKTNTIITEIVNYFDKNYTYIDIYIGDKQGNNIGKVSKNDTSIYGKETQYTSANYNTIYLQPEETTLNEGSELYIYVKFQLLTDTKNAEEILKEELLKGNVVNAMNLVEINGYKTEEGLIDIDSIPGNANVTHITKLLQGENVNSIYEDDINLSPQIKYLLTTTLNPDGDKIDGSRTIEGIVFEDSTGKNEKVYTKEKREGDGIIQQEETKIAGVIVQLIETKNGKIRAQTITDKGGWYGFVGYLPGDYKIRYIYGYDDKTAMTDNPPMGVTAGLNKKSYNGQEYQGTKYQDKENGYWYTIQDSKSDAKDNEVRKQKVIEYSKSVINHKGEVLSSYKNPQPNHIKPETTRALANELEENTYRYAYTEDMNIEIEYVTSKTEGNAIKEYKIKGVDFGIVERPKTKLKIDQDIKSIKVILSDGTEYINTEKNLQNVQWIKDQITDKNEKINITMDEELTHGATIEIIYNITVKNMSELDTGKIKASNIINYVSNNLEFDISDNLKDGKPLWEIVKVNDIQTNTRYKFNK